MPAASIYAFLEGLKDAGLEPGDLGITESLLDARGLLSTAQSTTPYALAEINLNKAREQCSILLLASNSYAYNE